MLFRKTTIWFHCCLSVIVESVSIWETGINFGQISEIDVGDIDPLTFYEKYNEVPFVIRRFHKSLTELADEDGSNDPVAWLKAHIDSDDFVDSVEAELRETRLAPTVHNVKWQYFFEKYEKLDMYAVTQAPVSFRKYLQLFPAIACGSFSNHMAVPHLWISGGKRSSKSVLHFDSYLNQHCVLKGSKRFLLIPPSFDIRHSDYGWVETGEGRSTPAGFEGAYGEFAGLIDTDNIDLNEYPKWKDVPWVWTELHAGDCIYMPFAWYHYVESNENEVTVTWHNWFNMVTEWREEDMQKKGCPSITHFTSDCVYKTDKHSRKGREHFAANPANDENVISFCE